MYKLAALAVTCLLCALLGAFAAYQLTRPKEKPLETPTVIEKIRVAARLESLDVRLYKKIDFAPDPQSTGTTWGDLGLWLKHTVHEPRGKAIVFAEAHLSVDLRKLDESRLRVVDGTTALVVLPAVQTRVELHPGETEVIGSNLDSAETAKLFQMAKEGFEREVQGDVALKARARESAEKSLGALLGGLGLRVRFVEELPAARSVN